MRAFDGMHPTLRQMPPGLSRSTPRAVFFNCPRRMPQTYPPGPAPMTSASVRMVSAIERLVLRDSLEMTGERPGAGGVHRRHDGQVDGRRAELLGRRRGVQGERPERGTIVRGIVHGEGVSAREHAGLATLDRRDGTG